MTSKNTFVSLCRGTVVWNSLGLLAPFRSGFAHEAH